MPYAIIDEFFKKFGITKNKGDRQDNFEWVILMTLIEIVYRLKKIEERVANIERKE